MNLIEQIDSDLISAIKANQTLSRDVLRMLKSSIKNQEIALGHSLNDEEVTSVIQKEVKKRVEAQESYRGYGKTELAETEKQESLILKKYLPEQMGEEEITARVKEYLKNNPTDSSQAGRAIGAVMGQLKGQADGNLVAKIVRQETVNK